MYKPELCLVKKGVEAVREISLVLHLSFYHKKKHNRLTIKLKVHVTLYYRGMLLSV